MRRTYLSIFGLLAFCLHCVAQKDATENWKQAMQLLPGYRVMVKQGIDSVGGEITKEGGLVIHFDMYGGAGNYADSDEAKKEMLWRTEQTLNGGKVICVYSKSKWLTVTFPPNTNFSAHIQNPKDLTDMLLMVLTFHHPLSDSTKPLSVTPGEKPK